MNKCIVLKEKWKQSEEEINKWLSNNPGVKVIAISQTPWQMGTVWTTIIYDE